MPGKPKIRFQRVAAVVNVAFEMDDDESQELAMIVRDCQFDHGHRYTAEAYISDLLRVALARSRRERAERARRYTSHADTTSSPGGAEGDRGADSD
jgi:hypothetical protein